MLDDQLYNKNTQHHNTMVVVVFLQRTDGSHLAGDLGDKKLVEIIDQLPMRTTTTTTTKEIYGLSLFPYEPPRRQSSVRIDRILT